MSGLKYFDMKIEYDHMVSKTSELEAENAKLRERAGRYCKALDGITCHCAEGVEVFPTYKIVKACYDEAMQALKGGE